MTATVPRSDTKRAILDAAERLFATQGFRAASLRHLTAEAEVNLGAVNYHFSTKDELVLAVLRRRIQPVNERRIAMLSRFEREASGRPVTIEKILEALFRPALELAMGRSGGRYFVRLLAQCLAEPDSYLQPLIYEEFAERNRRFHAALVRALPHLSSEEVHWRLHFAQGAFFHTVSNASVLKLSSKGRCQLVSIDSVLGKIIAFCAAGFQARHGKTEGEKCK